MNDDRPMMNAPADGHSEAAEELVKNAIRRLDGQYATFEHIVHDSTPLPDAARLKQEWESFREAVAIAKKTLVLEVGQMPRDQVERTKQSWERLKRMKAEKNRQDREQREDRKRE
jgi:hypothetical protein